MQEIINGIILSLMFTILISVGLIVALSNFKWFRKCEYYQNRFHSYLAGAIGISVGLTYLIIR